MEAYIIPALTAIVVAIIEALAYRDRKQIEKSNKAVEERASYRERESFLAMQMMDASIELGMATSIAVEEHKLNGEMKAAKEKAHKAQDEYKTYVQAIAAKQMAKV